MADFNNYIRERLAQGDNLEELAKEFADALNQQQKEKDAHEQEREENEKSNLAARELLIERIEKNDIDLDVITGALMYYFYTQNTELTKKELDTLYKEIRETIKIATNIVNRFNNKRKEKKRESGNVILPFDDLGKLYDLFF